MEPESTVAAEGTPVMENRRDGGQAYDVFISYSRRDKAFATKLQKALESYSPPLDLHAGRRSLHVFRDESDFTGVEYHEAIDRHLRQSASLILICSPHARHSGYVNEEVRKFVQSQGAANIIPVLLSGIPNNEASPDQEYIMAFPDALMDAMELPLAVSYLDFNPEKDKVDHGAYYRPWCGLLANLYHVSRSEIERRDLKRKARARLRTLSLMSTAIACLSILSMVAWIARGEAVRQRRLADQQKDFVLQAISNSTYNVSAELKPLLGTLPIRERLARQTINLLSQMRQANPGDRQVQRELATNHRLLASILQEKGRFDLAQAEYQTSADMVASMVEQQPSNDLWLRDLSVSLYNIALMQQRLNLPEAACRSYEHSLKAAERASDLNPQWLDLRKQVETAIKDLGCTPGRGERGQSAPPPGSAPDPARAPARGAG